MRPAIGDPAHVGFGAEYGPRVEQQMFALLDSEFRHFAVLGGEISVQVRPGVWCLLPIEFLDDVENIVEFLRHETS